MFYATFMILLCISYSYTVQPYWASLSQLNVNRLVIKSDITLLGQHLYFFDLLFILTNSTSCYFPTLHMKAYVLNLILTLTELFFFHMPGWWQRTCSTPSLAASSERVTTPPTSPDACAASQTSTWRLWAVFWITTSPTPSTPAAPPCSTKPLCGWISCARAAWKHPTWRRCLTYDERCNLQKKHKNKKTDRIFFLSLANTWDSLRMSYLTGFPFWSRRGCTALSEGHSSFVQNSGHFPGETPTSPVNPLVGAVRVGHIWRAFKSFMLKDQKTLWFPPVANCGSPGILCCAAQCKQIKNYKF